MERNWGPGPVMKAVQSLCTVHDLRPRVLQLFGLERLLQVCGVRAGWLCDVQSVDGLFVLMMW